MKIPSYENKIIFLVFENIFYKKNFWKKKFFFCGFLQAKRLLTVQELFETGFQNTFSPNWE